MAVTLAQVRKLKGKRVLITWDEVDEAVKHGYPPVGEMVGEIWKIIQEPDDSWHVILDWGYGIDIRRIKTIQEHVGD